MLKLLGSATKDICLCAFAGSILQSELAAKNGPFTSPAEVGGSLLRPHHLQVLAAFFWGNRKFNHLAGFEAALHGGPQRGV